MYLSYIEIIFVHISRKVIDKTVISGVVAMVMGGALNCLVLLLFQVLEVNFVVKVFECYVLEYLRGYRFYIVVYLMPKYGGNYYHGVVQK